MAQSIRAFAEAMPADFAAVEPREEERWPLGLTFAFVISTSLLLWLAIIATFRWLLFG